MKAKKFSKNNQKKSCEKTRKEIRKEKRQMKKVHRKLYNDKKKQTPGKFVLNPASNNNTENIVKKSVVKPKLSDEEKLKKQMELEKKREKRLAKQQERNRQIQLKEDNENEDREIKKLEKLLKLNKRKSKSIPKSYAADGLDYLLEFCDSETRKVAVETEKQLLGIDAESDFEEDFAMMAHTENEKIDEHSEFSDGDKLDDEVEHHMSEEEDEELQSNESDIDISDQADDFASDLEKETNDEEDQDDDNSMNEDPENSDEGSDDEKKADDGDMDENDDNFGDNTWEDIYGRKRDKDGNILSQSTEKYLPPAVRLKQLEKSSQESEKLIRLKRVLKGLINRLAEHNMHSIATQIEDLYMCNSRNDMNQVLVTLMMESIVSPVITPDRLIAEHMMLIAIIHANVGTEVGAHFLLSLVKEFDEFIKEPQDVEDKSLDNLILMLSHLYNFKIYGSQLLYEILGKLIEKFTEKEIELILLVLKTVGFLLRKDDPMALKELILNLQRKATASKSQNSRLQFMLDVLLAIKNNNMNKIPQYDPTHIEHLKKQLKMFLRKGNTVTQFNISLRDLLEVDERGKWWIVGSAWTGNIDNDKNDKNPSGTTTSQYSEKILELARKQRMNTDVRRSIFCILMTAEDYLDAFEKIQHLGLKDQQQREIIYVLIDCCLQEKRYNPYYAILAQKFCDYDRKNQMILQYSLWDKLKTINDFNNIQLHNLAKFLTHLFVEKGLPLSVLKIIQFGELDKPTLRLLRQIMLGILLHENTEVCLQVFERISLSPKLQTLREGLRLFISHFLVKTSDNKKLPEDEIRKLKERADQADKVLCKKNYPL